MTIYGVCTGKSIEEIEKEFAGSGYGDFKEAVAQSVIDELSPIQNEYKRILDDKAYVDEVLKAGAEGASRIADRLVSKVYKKVGLMQI